MDSNGVHSTPLACYATWFRPLKGQPCRGVQAVRSLAAERLPSNDVGSRRLGRGDWLASSPDRSIVVIFLKQDASADPFAEVLLDRSQSGTLPARQACCATEDSTPTRSMAELITSERFRGMRNAYLAYPVFSASVFVVTVLSFFWQPGRAVAARQASERLRLAKALELSTSPKIPMGAL